MLTPTIQIIVRLLLAGIDKEGARSYIKSKLDGWKETALLAVFDSAFALAEGAVGDRFGTMPFVSEEAWLTSTKLALQASPEFKAA